MRTTRPPRPRRSGPPSPTSTSPRSPARVSSTNASSRDSPRSRRHTERTPSGSDVLEPPPQTFTTLCLTLDRLRWLLKGLLPVRDFPRIKSIQKEIHHG